MHPIGFPVMRSVSIEQSIVATNELPSESNADEIFEHSFLEVRAKLLEVAAVLDRVDRAEEEHGSLRGTANQLRSKTDDAVRILLSEGPDRARRLQQLFSREYESDWRDQMQI